MRSVRVKQLTQKGEIEKKDIIIAKITIKMNELQEWSKTIEERTIGDRPVLLPRSPSGESTAVGVSAQELGNKPRRKTRWEPFSPE